MWVLARHCEASEAISWNGNIEPTRPGFDPRPALLSSELNGKADL